MKVCKRNCLIKRLQSDGCLSKEKMEQNALLNVNEQELM